MTLITIALVVLILLAFAAKLLVTFKKTTNMPPKFDDLLRELSSKRSDLSLDEIRAKYGDSVLKSKDEINQITGKFYKEFKRTPNVGCLHPRPKECTGKPIGSHSIQKALILLLADATHHVLMFNSTFSHNRQPTASMNRVGVNEASVFLGLCAKHDSETFNLIENVPLDINNKEQHFLFAYRAILKECTVKNKNYELTKRLCKDYLDQGNADEFMSAYFMINAYVNYQGLFYTEKIKRLLDISLLTKKFDDLVDHQVRVIDA